MSEEESEYTSSEEDISDIEFEEVTKTEIKPIQTKQEDPDEEAKKKERDEQRKANLRENLVKARAKAKENREMRKIQAAHKVLQQGMDELEEGEEEEEEEEQPKQKGSGRPRCEHRFLKGKRIGEFCTSFAVTNGRCNKHKKIKQIVEPGVFWKPRERREDGSGIVDDEERPDDIPPPPKGKKPTKAETKKILQEQKIALLGETIAKSIVTNQRINKKRPPKVEVKPTPEVVQPKPEPKPEVEQPTVEQKDAKDANPLIKSKSKSSFFDTGIPAKQSVSGLPPRAPLSPSLTLSSPGDMSPNTMRRFMAKNLISKNKPTLNF